MRRFIAHALSPVLLLALGILCAAERPAHATAQGESLLGVTGRSRASPRSPCSFLDAR